MQILYILFGNFVFVYAFELPFHGFLWIVDDHRSAYFVIINWKMSYFVLFLKLYQLLKLERFTQNVSMRYCKWPMCCRAGFLDICQLPVSISTGASLWLCWGWVCCVEHGRGESVTKQFVPFRAVQTYPWLFEISPP